MQIMMIIFLNFFLQGDAAEAGPPGQMGPHGPAGTKVTY